MLRRLEFHRDVKPIEDPTASQLTAVDGLLEFTGGVADHGHTFIGHHAVSAEELIESRCGRGDFLVHIGIQLCGTVRERRSPGHDVDVTAAAYLRVAMSHPRRVNAHVGDMARFANRYIQGPGAASRCHARFRRRAAFQEGERDYGYR